METKYNTLNTKNMELLTVSPVAKKEIVQASHKINKKILFAEIAHRYGIAVRACEQVASIYSLYVVEYAFESTSRYFDTIPSTSAKEAVEQAYKMGSCGVGVDQPFTLEASDYYNSMNTTWNLKVVLGRTMRHSEASDKEYANLFINSLVGRAVSLPCGKGGLVSGVLRSGRLVVNGNGTQYHAPLSELKFA